MSNAKRKVLKEAESGRGPVDKIGVKDRATGKVVAKSVKDANSNTVQGFVKTHTDKKVTVYIDEAQIYSRIARKHETINHSAKEFVRHMAHTNGIESFWALLKRGYHGTFHHFSDKHLDHYVNEFAGRCNLRELDTVEIFRAMIRNMEGKRIKIRELMA